MGIEEFLRAVEADELADKVATQTKATPIEYARSRGITPQRVYYLIRNKRLDKERCVCGRPVIDIEDADTVLGFNEE